MSKELQKIFDRAVGGILKQGRASITIDINDRPQCMYRGYNDTKCAVGHLIPDDIYDPKMEIGIVVLCGENLKIRELFKDVNINMLRALQRAHDNSNEIRFVDDFKIKAFDVAAYYSLNADVLK